MSRAVMPVGWDPVRFDTARDMMAADGRIAREAPAERCLEPYRCTTREAATSMLCEGETPNHRFTVDEPVSSGGTDTTPNPVETVLAGLGCSLQVTARLHAIDRGLAVAGLRVEMDGVMDFRGFFDAAPVAAGLVSLTTTLFIDTAIGQEDFAWLAARVRRCCPVLGMLGGAERVGLAIVREGQAR